MLERRAILLLGVCVQAFSVGIPAGAADPDTQPQMPVSYASVSELEAPVADSALRYGDDPHHTLLRFDSENAVLADIVLIHGGCWSASYDRRHILPLAAALAEEGYRVWVPEYRRVGNQGGGWPGTWEDVRAVIERVKKESAGVLLAVGHSAGGHLALMAATEAAPDIDGAVGLAPITDLVAYARGDNSCQVMAPKLMGMPLPDAVEHYRAASPAYRAPTVPVVILQGSDDPIVSLSQASAFPEARLITRVGAGHFDLIHPATPLFDDLLEALVSIRP